MKAKNREALEKMAADNGLDIEIKEDPKSRTITAKRKKVATKKAATPPPTPTPDSELMEIIKQNNRLLSLVSHQPSKKLENLANMKIDDIPAPREWRCTVKRDKEGFIETFTLKQILN